MIEFKNVTLSFSDKPIFQDFSNVISEGDKVLLNAPSGAGKSTLLKMIMGFVQPDDGLVLVDSQQIDSDTIKELRQMIAYLPQEVSFPRGKVEDVIKDIFGFHSNRELVYDQSQVVTLFNELYLDKSILNSDTNELSGGEKQRLGIVVMRLLKRKIFLLDEITSALNSELKTIICDYFMSLDETVIVVSHDDVWKQTNMKRLEW